MSTSQIRTMFFGGVIVLALASPWLVWIHEQGKLRAKQHKSSIQVADLERLKAEAAESGRQKAAAPSLSEDELKELLKLRSEVGQLRLQTNQIRVLRDENLQLRTGVAAPHEAGVPITQDEYAAQLMAETRAAMQNIVPALPLAVERFAAEHNNASPRTFADLRKYLRTVDGRPMTGIYSFEFADQNQPRDLSAKAPILRESQGHKRPEGGVAKYYGYADGGVIEAISADGDFANWELEHGVPPFVPPARRRQN